MTFAYKIIDSPVGKLKLVASDQGLAGVLWERENARPAPLSELVVDEEHPVLLETERQLGEYFAGKRKTFSIPLDLRGTAFQQKVWRALQQIPAGETRSYSQLAAELGQPSAARAVARACATNRIALAVPCHRVNASDGSLAGYYWGLERKRKLQAAESNN